MTKKRLVEEKMLHIEQRECGSDEIPHLQDDPGHNSGEADFLFPGLS